MQSKKLTLTTRVLIGLLAGLAFSFILRAMPDSEFKSVWIINGALRVMAEVFLNAIWFVVIPLILVSLIVGVSGISDARKIGRMGGKVVAFYLVTTALAVAAAMFFSYVLNPAGSVDLTSVVEVEPTINTPPPVLNVLIGIVPRNVFAALSDGNTLQVIFLAVFAGLAMVKVGAKAKPVMDLMVSLNDIVLKLVEMVMFFAPFGVFALIARNFYGLGFDAILSLIAFVGVVWLVLVLHVVVVYGALMKILLGKDPVTGKRVSFLLVIRKLIPALTMAFSTASSAATLPVTMRCADNLGIHRNVSSFSLPLGVTINMDGTAIYQGVAAIFLASILGVSLSASQVLTILVTATLASIGTAGVPGAGMIMLSIVLTNVGIPVEAIAIIFGIDRIVDMPRTLVNICGDAVCSMIVAKGEGELDFEQLNRKTAA